MKVSGRALQLNCVFLAVVALLVCLQLLLQRSHKTRQLTERGVGEGERAPPGPPLPPPLQDPAKDHLPSNAIESEAERAGAGSDRLLAAPLVPNIRKSFTKRKAPYVRKGKKDKKRRNHKNKQQKNGMRGGGGRAAGEREQQADLRPDKRQKTRPSDKTKKKVKG